MKNEKEKMIKQLTDAFIDLSKALAGKPLFCSITACLKWLEIAETYNPEIYTACQKFFNETRTKGN